MNDSYIILSIIVATIATYATRKLPFLLFDKRRPGPMIQHIETHMPSMIMVILVFYAIRDVPFAEAPYGAPELLGIMVAGVVHLWFKNALLSIISATILYMFLVQQVF